MVHRPDLAHERLSPTNCHELLFDDVIWVRRARQEFDAFVDLMRERGVEVLLFHDLLAETLEDAEAREWLLSRRVRPEEVTVMFAEPLTDWLTEMPADELATRLTGGVTVAGAARRRSRSAIGQALRADRLRPAAAPEPALHARHERLDLRRRLAQPDVLAGAPARDAERRGDLPLPPALPRRRASRSGSAAPTTTGAWRGIEGGDIMPVGDGVVLVGMGERSTARAVEHPRAEPLRRRRRPARDRRADAARARGDAPRHRLHVLRPQRRDALRAGRLADPPDPASRPGGDGGVQAEVSERSFLDEVQGRARDRRS